MNAWGWLGWVLGFTGTGKDATPGAVLSVGEEGRGGGGDSSAVRVILRGEIEFCP